jgi:hypothetical protein
MITNFHNEPHIEPQLKVRGEKELTAIVERMLLLNTLKALSRADFDHAAQAIALLRRKRALPLLLALCRRSKQLRRLYTALLELALFVRLLLWGRS